MADRTYGLIVEGDYDKAVLSELVSRLAGLPTSLPTLVCRGRPRLMEKFPHYLRALEYQIRGEPVDKAFVFQDSNGRDPATVRAEMQQRIAGQHYSFPLGLHLCILVQALEAWLLADPTARQSVVHHRTGRALPAPNRPHPEAIRKPKQLLTGWLGSGPAYTDELAREIAAESDLVTLEQRCPSFGAFKNELLDC